MRIALTLFFAALLAAPLVYRHIEAGNRASGEDTR